MLRHVAILGVAALAFAPVAGRAEVENGHAAAKVPDYLARGATESGDVGPLAPSLQGKPVVARIHADWCAACKATEATLDGIKQAYAGRVTFVQFDVTNGKTAEAAQKEAQELGLGKFYDSAKAATSTVAVIDPRDGKVFGTFYNDGKEGDYSRAIDAALTTEGK